MTNLDIDWGLVLRGVGVAASVTIGFVGGYLAAEKADKRSMRSVEAALFAARTLKQLLGNLRASALENPNWFTMIADGYDRSKTLETTRYVLTHVRAVDLPEAVRIDTLAKIEFGLRMSERAVAKAAAGQDRVEHFAETLDDQINDLTPLVEELAAELARLDRPVWRKALSKAAFWRKKTRAHAATPMR